MNKQPISYLQIDMKWKKLPYRVKGEDATIGGSGCGPTSAAMLIETMTGKTFTPVDACNWSMAHGYKALNNGTYYSYFVPQFKEFGITCRQALASRILNKPDHPIHDEVKKLLQEGYYAIALMGPGQWTKSGHFVVVWWWDDKSVYINDPASTRLTRLRGDVGLFKQQVRNYWLIDAREYNNGDDEMLSYDQFKEYMNQYRKELGMAEADGFAQSSIETCITAGILQNVGTSVEMKIDRPKDFVTRQEAAIIAGQILRTKED